MKKHVLISVFFAVALFFSANVFAQYPISSYDTPTEQGTYFTMTHGTTSPTMSAEKRKVNIETSDPGTSSAGSSVTIVVYSLDLQDYQGPFTIEVGTSKSIDIDDRDWGVVVIEQTGKCLMSVYTESTEIN